MVSILHANHDFGDVRDDHILEVAVIGHVQIIVSGDEDLLGLNNFWSILIMRPASFLKWKIAASQSPNNRIMHIYAGPYHSILLKAFKKWREGDPGRGNPYFQDCLYEKDAR